MAQMTVEEALMLVDRMLSQISTTRENHFQLQQAVAVLANATAKPNPEPEKKGTRP